MLKSSRFCASSYEQVTWENIALILPKRSQPRLGYDPCGENKGPESASISIEKRGYFTLEIILPPDVLDSIRRSIGSVE